MPSFAPSALLRPALAAAVMSVLAGCATTTAPQSTPVEASVVTKAVGYLHVRDVPPSAWT